MAIDDSRPVPAMALDAAAPGWPLDGPITRPTEFQDAVRGLLGHAAEKGVRTLWWASPSFEGWPLDEVAVLDAMSRWARRPSVQLTWLAQDFEPLRRHRPRLTRWRQTWSHVVQCVAPDEVGASDIPTVLVADDALMVRLIDASRWRGRVTRDLQEIRAVREGLDALLQRSKPAFPATTLGI